MRIITAWTVRERQRARDFYGAQVQISQDEIVLSGPLLTISHPDGRGCVGVLEINEIRDEGPELEFTVFLRALVNMKRRVGGGMRTSSVHLWGLDVRADAQHFLVHDGARWKSDRGLDEPALKLGIDRLIDGNFQYRAWSSLWRLKSPDPYGAV